MSDLDRRRAISSRSAPELAAASRTFESRIILLTYLLILILTFRLTCTPILTSNYILQYYTGPVNTIDLDLITNVYVMMFDH